MMNDEYSMPPMNQIHKESMAILDPQEGDCWLDPRQNVTYTVLDVERYDGILPMSVKYSKASKSAVEEEWIEMIPWVSLIRFLLLIKTKEPEDLLKAEDGDVSQSSV